ncbi:MAG: VCBS repeat-containing protein [Calditrichaeota bacterium]|nr:VCBS repeat-containing protein [Calditrichota bacterium]
MQKIKLSALIYLIAILTCVQIAQSEPSNLNYQSEGEFWGWFLVGETYDTGRDEADRIGFLFGWPRRLEGEVYCWRRTPTVLDIDNNGDWEIAVINGEGQLFVYQHDGAYYPGFPTRIHYGGRPRAWENPTRPAMTAVGDINDRNLADQIYITDIGFLHVVDESTAEPRPFPLDLGRGWDYSSTAAINLDGEIYSEIVFTSSSATADSSRSIGYLHIINARGREAEGWPVSYVGFSNSAPAVGDIDRNGSYDIFIGSGRSLNQQGAINGYQSDGRRLAGFPVGHFETIGGSPSLADINNDGFLEVLFWAAEADTNICGIFAFDRNGRIVENYPLPTRTGHPYGNVAIADITGDGRPEIVFGTYDPLAGALIYAWRSSGELLPHFPISAGGPAVVGSVALADISGDRRADIVAAIAPVEGGQGKLGVWDFNSEPVEGFPLLLVEWGGGAFAGTPTIWDVNRDGYNDIIALTTDRRMLIWGTPGRVGQDTWCTERGNMSRTGLRPANDPRSAPEEQTFIPTIQLLSLSPNPFNRAATITLTTIIPGRMTLDMYEPGGRLVSRLFTGEVNPGILRLHLDLAKPNLGSGLYLIRSNFIGGKSQTLRAVYLP